MKIAADFLIPCLMLLAACSTNQDEATTFNGPDTNTEVDSLDTTDRSDSATSSDATSSSDDTDFSTDPDTTDSTFGSDDEDSDYSPKDTETEDTDPFVDIDTSGQDPPDLDTEKDYDGYGCTIPTGLLEPQNGESGYALFDFGGTINDPSSEAPQSGDGSFAIKLRGQVMPLEVESMTATYSYTMPGVIIKGYSRPDPATGEMFYLEAKIATADLIEMHAAGEDHVDIFDLPTGNSSPTNVRVYEGVRNPQGGIDKLCLSALPGTRGNPELTDLWPLWVCNTSIDWMSNVGEFFGMAGNIAMFDHIGTIEDSYGMRCVCPNGAGSWRNCDSGTPEAYGLLKFNFKFGAKAGDWWSNYIYDEEILARVEGLDDTYGNQHPEGIWQHYWAPILGGLNISARATDPTDGSTIYRFGELLTPQSEITVLGLISKDSKNKRFVLRQHAFNSNDPSGKTKEGYWINAYLPDDIAAGDAVSFGVGKNKGKLFVYDPNQNNCILAIACAGSVRVQTSSTDLAAKEGGRLHLKTEVDGFDTRQSVQLWHPKELPADCDWNTYLAQSRQPTNIAICDKI